MNKICPCDAQCHCLVLSILCFKNGAFELTAAVNDQKKKKNFSQVLKQSYMRKLELKTEKHPPLQVLQSITAFICNL